MVGCVLLGIGLAQADDRTVVLRHADHVALVVVHVDRLSARPEVWFLEGHSTPPEYPAT